MNLEKEFRKFQKNLQQGKYKSIVRTGSFGVAVACAAFLSGYYFQGRQAESEIDRLREAKASVQSEGEGTMQAYGSSNMILAQYEELASENPDMIGWLTIDGTSIDYPVMWTPEDPEYYSRRGFDKKESKNGLLFMDEISNMEDEGGNIIIYGHNMKNGSMFADLLKYKDKAYWEEHPSIQLDTLYETRIYEIASVTASEDINELPFGFTAMEDEGAEEVIERMKANSLYETSTNMEYGDDFLTLSTCDYSEDEARMIIMAKRIQ